MHSGSPWKSTFEAFDFRGERWDLIVLTYEPTKAIAPKVARDLRPGGIVVVEDRPLATRKVWVRPDSSVKKLDERLVRLLAEKPVPRIAGCVWDGKGCYCGGKRLLG